MRRIGHAWTMAVCMSAGAWCAEWSGPVLIDDLELYGERSQPSVDMAASGRAIAAWSVGILPQNVYANCWNGESWTGPVCIDGGVLHTRWFPDVAVAEDGTGMAVFRARLDDEYRYVHVYANRWDGTQWTGAVSLESAPYGSTAAAVAVGGDGTAIAVFEYRDETGTRICANHWNGAAWTGPLLIDAGPGVEMENPKIGMDANGKGIALFERDGHGSYAHRVYANHWNGAAWTGAVPIDEEGKAGIYLQRHSLSVNSAGYAMAVFTRVDGRAVATRWDGAQWTIPEPIDPVLSRTWPAPQVSLGEDGQAIAVFVHDLGDFLDNEVRFYANHWDGTEWAEAVPIDDASAEGWDFQIAADSSGNGIALYQDSRSGYRVYANCWNGLAWTGPALIDLPHYLGDICIAQIAMGGDGAGIAVFDQRPYPWLNDGMYANRYVLSSEEAVLRINMQPSDEPSAGWHIAESGLAYGLRGWHRYGWR